VSILEKIHVVGRWWLSGVVRCGYCVCK